MAEQLGLTGARSMRTTSSLRRTTSSPMDRRSASNAGRSRAAIRRRRSPPRSPGWSRRPISRAPMATCPRPRSGCGVADDMQRSIKSWTVTTTGPLSNDPYFIRLSKNGDPNEAVSYGVGNGGPTLDQRAVIDAGFLELVRLGLLPASDPDVARSLPIVDDDHQDDDAERSGLAPLQRRRLRRSRQRRSTVGAERAGDRAPLAGAVRRACRARPGHGRCDDRRVAPERHAQVRIRRGAHPRTGLGDRRIVLGSRHTARTRRSPRSASQNGKAAGSASPLTWSAASFVRLAADLAAGRNVVLPASHHSSATWHTRRRPRP